MTLTPAYGRDYKNAKEVKAAWDQGRDFIIADIMHPDSGRYVNKPQLPGQTAMIRYAGLRKIVQVKG